MSFFFSFIIIIGIHIEYMLTSDYHRSKERISTCIFWQRLSRAPH